LTVATRSNNPDAQGEDDMRISNRLFNNALVSILLALVFPVVGCNQGNPARDSTPALFEIREINWDRTDGESAWTYQCRATLIARDARFQKGQVVVFHKQTVKHKNGKLDEAFPSFVVLTDGVGTLSAGAYYSHKQKMSYGGSIGEYDSDPGQPDVEWRVLGYVPLEPAQLSVAK
jgi:hypothetical protein